MPRLHFCEKLRNASEVNLACTNTYPNFREDLQIFEEEFSREDAKRVLLRWNDRRELAGEHKTQRAHEAGVVA